MNRNLWRSMIKFHWETVAWYAPPLTNFFPKTKHSCYFGFIRNFEIISRSHYICISFYLYKYHKVVFTKKWLERSRLTHVKHFSDKVLSLCPRSYQWLNICTSGGWKRWSLKLNLLQWLYLNSNTYLMIFLKYFVLSLHFELDVYC